MKRRKHLYPKYFLSHNEIFPNGVFNIPLDENGVATWDYKGHLGLHEEYNPTMIALYTLSMYNLYYDTLKKYLDEFFRNANYLVKNLAGRGTYGVWLVNFPWIAPCYLCKPPWVSGLSQGLGISVMVRAWTLTKDNKYLHAAEKALASFEVPISKGGVLTIDKGGSWWYDEYACTKSANVLNGFLCALIGIHELYDVTKDGKAKFLLSKGIETAKKFMKRFDLNLFIFKWSKYDDKLLVYSGPKYHEWHVKQLMKLYEITEDREFLNWAAKWSRYQEKYNSITKAKWFVLFWRFYSRVIKKLYKV